MIFKLFKFVFLGKKPLYFILGAFCLLLSFIATMEGIAWHRSHNHPFELDDVRSPENTYPYIVDNTSITVPVKREVHGKYFSYSFQKLIPNPNLNSYTNPKQVVVAKAGESVTLPDGSIFHLKALEILCNPSYEEVQNGFLNTNGDWMTEEEAFQFVSINELDVFEEYDFRNSSEPYAIFAYFSQNKNIENFIPTEIYPEIVGVVDTVTGFNIGNPSYGISYFKSFNLPIQDEDYNDLSICGYKTYGIRPTTVAFQFRIWHGKPESIQIPMSKPYSFRWRNNDYSIKSIVSRRSFSGEEEFVYGDSDSSNKSSDSRTGNYSVDSYNRAFTKFEFDQKLPDGIEKSNLLKRNYLNDEVVWVEISDIKANTITCNQPYYEIDRLEIKVWPEYTLFVMELPVLPIVPRENFSQKSYLDMKLPRASLDHALGGFIQRIKQIHAEGQINGTSRSGPISSDFPIDFSNMSVRQVLNYEKSFYEDHDVVLTSNGVNSVLLRVESNHYIHSAPWLIRVITWVYLHLAYFVISVMGILILKMFVFAFTNSLFRKLKNRGFTEVDFWKAEELFFLIQHRAWSIPAFQDLATIPGVDVEDMQSIAAFIRRQRTF